MKKIKFVVISVCIAFFSACSGTNEYVVSGVVPEEIEDGEIVLMSDLNDGIIFDTAEVIEGKFLFNGMADEFKAVNISLGGYSVNLVLEKGKISVDMEDQYGTKGSPLTDIFNDFMGKSGTLLNEAREKLVNVETLVDKSIPDYENEVNKQREAIIDELFTKMDELPQSYLKKHPNDILGAIIFYTWMQNQMQPSAEKFEESSKLVGEYVLNYGPVKQLAEYFDKLGNTSAGAAFVDFTIENGNLDGSSVSLSDYVGKGKYVLVDFWASWCGPCRKEAPVLAEVYDKYKGERFEVLGVAVWDRRDATLQAMEEDGYKWPQILDAQSIPTELYGIQGIPHIILFGPDGKIVARDLRGNNLKEKVAEVMN